MPTRILLTAALAAFSLACAGNAAAQTDVLVVEGTSVGILDHAPTTRDPAGNLATARRDEQKYIRVDLYEPIVIGVPSRAAQSDAVHREEIHIESFSWGASSGANDGPDLMLKSATGRHIPRGGATDAGTIGRNADAPPQASPFFSEKLGDIKGQGADRSRSGAAGAPGSLSVSGQKVPAALAPTLAAPVGRR